MSYDCLRLYIDIIFSIILWRGFHIDSNTQKLFNKIKQKEVMKKTQTRATSGQAFVKQGDWWKKTAYGKWAMVVVFLLSSINESQISLETSFNHVIGRWFRMTSLFIICSGRGKHMEQGANWWVIPSKHSFLYQIYPLQVSRTQDFMYWKYPPNGIYSVTSSYHLARMKYHQMESKLEYWSNTEMQESSLMPLQTDCQ